MKVVINACYGGFGLSPAAILKLYEMGCPHVDAAPVSEYYRADMDGDSILGFKKNLEKWREYLAAGKAESLFLTVFTPDEKKVLSFDRGYSSGNKCRTDAMLIQVVEEMGDAANGQCAKLRVVDVPDDASWEIDEYDGFEHVAEKHRTWS